MVIEVVKALNNKKYVSKRQENYYALSRFTKRIWINDEVDIVCDGSVIYELRINNGLAVEGRVLGKGYDETGFYIIFNMYSVDLDNDIADLRYIRIPRGKAELTEVFNPYGDEAFKELFNDQYMAAYIFNSTHMDYKRTGNVLELEFKLGGLGDEAMHIVLSGIFDEVYQCEDNHGWDDFRDGKIAQVYFRKDTGGKYTVKINSRYEDIIYPQEDECFSEYAEVKIIEHHNQGIVRCNELVVKKYNYFLSNLKSHDIQCFHLRKGSGDNPAEKLREKWRKVFLEGVNVEGAYIDQYLWHAFSYRRIIAIEGEEANKFLDAEKSTTLYVFLNSSNVYSEKICYRLENAADFTHDMLQCYADVYVTDENFTWTYVRTHEAFCGPYFYRK